MKRAARVDANQAEIVRDLRRIGADVVDLHALGHDVPDILVGFRGVNYLVEIKTERGRLSDGQQRFATTWPGQTAEARSLDDVLRLIGAEVGGGS